MEYKTFSTKGLTEAQIKFLSEVEKQYLQGEEISTDMLMKVFRLMEYQKGSEEAKQCVEAWQFWTSIPHPYDYKSVENPLQLDQVLKIVDRETPGAFLVYKRDGGSFYALPNMDYFNGLKLSLIYPFHRNHFHFNLNKYGALYLVYDAIIGSRYIC